MERSEVASLTVLEIFDRLDALQVALSTSAQRWFLAHSAGTAKVVLDERKDLHRDRHILEEELHRRCVWSEPSFTLPSAGTSPRPAESGASGGRSHDGRRPPGAPGALQFAASAVRFVDRAGPVRWPRRPSRPSRRQR